MLNFGNGYNGPFPIATRAHITQALGPVKPMITISIKSPAGFPHLKNWEFSLEKGKPLVLFGEHQHGLRLFESWLENGLQSDDVMISSGDSLEIKTLCLHDEWELLEKIRKEDDSEFMEGGFDPGPSLEDILLSGNEKSQEFISLGDRLEINHLLDSPFRFLSNGEIRKGLLLKAIQSKPDLLILSSPYEGLDREWRHEINQLLADLFPEMSILLLIQRHRDWPDWIKFGHQLLNDSSPRPLSSKESSPDPSPLEKIKVPEHLLTASQPEINPKLPLVDIRSLTIQYGSRYVLKDFSWSVAQGENWLVTGRNGMGKTTLMDLVYADHDQSYGQDFSLFGIQRGSGESIWDLRKYMGRVNVDTQRRIQNDQPVLSMVVSGLEDTLGLRRPLQPHEQKQAMEWLELLGLSHLSEKYCHQLDYGDLRAVLMARALIKVPKLLILDEPSQGLTQEQHAKVIAVVGHILERCPCSVLYVTHHPNDAPLPFSHHLELKQVPEGHSNGVVHQL